MSGVLEHKDDGDGLTDHQKGIFQGVRINENIILMSATYRGKPVSIIASAYEGAEGYNIFPLYMEITQDVMVHIRDSRGEQPEVVEAENGEEMIPVSPPEGQPTHAELRALQAERLKAAGHDPAKYGYEPDIDVSELEIEPPGQDWSPTKRRRKLDG